MFLIFSLRQREGTMKRKAMCGSSNNAVSAVKRGVPRLPLTLLLLSTSGTFLFGLLSTRSSLLEEPSANEPQHLVPEQQDRIKRVFVNYAYSEIGGRSDSPRNLGFFLRHGVTAPKQADLTVEFGLVVNGNCTHTECQQPETFFDGSKVKLHKLFRENRGFDFGAHTAMLEQLEQEHTVALPYDVYIFLNGGVTGPIAPSYMPHDWHWTRAFTDKLNKNSVGLVGTAIACLPPRDRGGYGPKVEAFAFGLSAHALQIVRQQGTSFQQHPTKVSAILSGEYNMTTVLLRHGVNIDCLLKSYQGMDWRNESNWNCNTFKHPSRRGSYFGISMHPLEILFHKTHWAGQKPVLEDYIDKYMEFDDRNKMYHKDSVP